MARSDDREPCYRGCSEAECDCPRCEAADAAWERDQGWDERDDYPDEDTDEDDDWSDLDRRGPEAVASMRKEADRG